VTAVLAICANELRRVVRDRTAAFFVAVLPVVIMIVIGTTFGAVSSDLPVGVVDLDGSAASRELAAALDRSPALDVTAYGDEDDLRTDVRTGRVEGGVVVPAGYGAALGGGATAAVGLLTDPGGATATPIRSAVTGAVGGQARVQAAATFAAEATGGDRAALVDVAAAEAGGLAPVAVAVERIGDPGRGDLSPFSYTAPSNLVLFLFVNSLTVGAVLATDRRNGITRRLLVTPHPASTIVAGVGLAKFAFALVQGGLILAVGLLFDVDWGDPVAVVLLTVVFAVVSTAVGLLVGATARSADTAQSIAVPVAIGMAMLGGCMWPLDLVPPVMRVIGHAVPHAWAMDGWTDLVLDGEGLGAVAVELVVLSGYAAVLLALAAWRLRVALTT
jgi:ABC-2 type transport system permease protein